MAKERTSGRERERERGEVYQNEGEKRERFLIL